MPGRVSYKMKVPVDILDKEGNLITKLEDLSLRDQVTTGDLRGIPMRYVASPGDMPADDMMKIVGRLSGHSEIEMNKVDYADILGLTEVVSGFLLRGLPIGLKDSQT